MKAVDPYRGLARCTTELGLGIHLDRMGEVSAAVDSHVVVLEVLEERATHRYVDHLLATTDSEHGELLLSRQAKQLELGVIELAVDRANRLVSFLAVQGWVDIPTTRKQEPVHVREPGAPGRKDNGLPPGGFDRPFEGVVVSGLPLRTDRDADLGASAAQRRASLILSAGPQAPPC